MKKDTVTKVKDHRYELPGLTLADAKRKSVSVYLNTDTGMFTMTLPAEVVKVLNCIDHSYGRELGECIREFTRTIEKYHNIIRSQASKPVLLVHFAYNRPRIPAKDCANLWGVRQLGEKAPEHGFGLDYQLLYRIGDHLYDLSVDEDSGEVYGAPQHRYSLPVKGRRLVEWSAERQRFLDEMIAGLAMLADRCNEFFAKDFLENMDRAIASGIGGFAALPAPVA